MTRERGTGSDHGDGQDVPGGSGASGILTSIGEAVYEWTLANDGMRWGGNALAVLGVDSLAPIATGQRFGELLDPENLTTPFDTIVNSAYPDTGTGVPYQIEYALRLPGPGTVRHLWIEDTGRWFAGPDGRPAKAHGVVRVITKRHENEQKIAYLSRFDELTGQMNRIRLVDILQDAVSNATRHRTSCAFVILSIDNLSVINEAYGFDVADQIIVKISGRIKSRLRVGDAIGRFSGNKFGLVLMNCGTDEIDIAARRFLNAMAEEIVTTDKGSVAATVTIGAVCIPAYAKTAGEAINFAQEALDRAKGQGRGSFVNYEPSPIRSAERRDNLTTSTDILKALNDRRVRLAYQPIMKADGETVAFHECLMRIEQDDGTVVPAGRLIPVAEKLGLVRLIDHRILTLVLEDLAAFPEARLSVNVSPQSAAQQEWLETLSAGLRGLPQEVASRLIVEITETAAIQNLEETVRFVSQVRSLGAKIAIDDFGAGYTSFRNLKALDLDIVKIDGSFVENLAKTADDRVFVRTLVDLASAFSIETVAEWVSDIDSARLLKEMGVDYLQGNHLARAALNRPWTDGRSESDAA
ncbi:MAG: EAL domain-containing protein [Pseudomonadota bacterium]